jgi:hypothetical protein
MTFGEGHFEGSMSVHLSQSCWTYIKLLSDGMALEGMVGLPAS